MGCVNSVSDIDFIYFGKEETAMYDSRKSMNRRIASGLMAFILLVIMLFSAFYIAAETDHVCTGEDCPICACIAQCENILYQLGDGITVQLAVIVPIIFMLVVAFLFASDFARETPVSRKVRLNN